MSGTSSRPPRTHDWKVALVAGLLATAGLFLLLETGTRILLRFRPDLNRYREARHFTVDPAQIARMRPLYDRDLGWIAPSRARWGERPGAPAAKKEPAGQSAWIATFGDSFTFGYEVDDASTWEEHLKRLSGREVLNFGVPGYGTDQALLRLKSMPASLRAEYAILAFIQDDLIRNLNIYRPFKTPTDPVRPFTKPRFELRNGQLVLVPNPVQSVNELQKLSDPDFIVRLARQDGLRTLLDIPEESHSRAAILRNGDFWHRAFNPKYEEVWTVPPVMALAQRIFTEFERAACERGMKPLIVFIPHREIVKELREKSDRSFLTMQQLDDFCEGHRGHCWSALEALARAPSIDALFAPKAHLSAKGNLVLAQGLQEYISSAKIDCGTILETHVPSRR